jgi:FkbM family methyltransferase
MALPLSLEIRRLVFEPINWIAKLTSPWTSVGQKFAVAAFKFSGGDRLRNAIPPPDKGLTVDLGGYLGDFAAEIRQVSGCRILVFEAVPAFAKDIAKRFAKDKGVEVFAYGLAGKDQRLTFVLDGMASGASTQGGKKVQVSLKAAEPFFRARKIKHIDLMKLNIEGGEFELLERLVDTPWMGSIGRIQVQFHPFERDARFRRIRLRKALAKTHVQEWNYPWIWESWRLRAGA